MYYLQIRFVNPIYFINKITSIGNIVLFILRRETFFPCDFITEDFFSVYRLDHSDFGQKYDYGFKFLKSAYLFKIKLI